MSIDWIKIKNEYVTSNISYKAIAEKYSVNRSTLEKRAVRECWTEQRKEACKKIDKHVQRKTQNAIIAQEINRIQRLYDLSDKIIEKLELAIEQLDISLITNKKRVREVEYTDSTAIAKPTREVITDTEEIEQVVTIIDRNGLKQLASALKDIKEVQTTLEASMGGDAKPVIVDDIPKGDSNE